MSQVCQFSQSETKNNPLYQKMRERFSFGGSVTIGEMMLRRVAREESSYLDAPVVKEQQKEAEVAPKRRHTTAISCILLAFVAVCLIVVLLSSYTGLSITASPADSDPVVSGDAVQTQVPDASDAEVPCFSNVLDAMDQAFGE